MKNDNSIVTTDTEIELKLFSKVADALSKETIKQQVLQEEELRTLYFSENNLPILPVGEYSVHVKQTVEIIDSQNISLDSIELAKESGKFKVEYDLLEPLTPSDVYTAFPPKGTFADYTSCVPHISLNRSTFPWEGTHLSNKPTVEITNLSWLALVVLERHEIEEEKKEDSLIKIKIDKSLIPSSDALQYLVHTVKKTEENEEAKAVLTANRLCRPDATNIIHLIALNEVDKDGFYTSLFHWTFTCDKQQNKDFKGTIENLNSGLFRLPNLETDNTFLDNCLKQGYVPVPHFARNGQRIMSWYRSPLVSSMKEDKKNGDINIVSNSDQLLRYFEKTKRLDTSYSAAWALGKWLTLNQKEFATELYNWKKKFAIVFKHALEKLQLREEVEKDRDFLHIENYVSEIFQTNIDTLDLPSSLKDWFNQLKFLKPVPFVYLIPDIQMLPTESIRFFQIDDRWIWALIDGAMSIGRLSHDEQIVPIDTHNLCYSGFLIRSKLVSSFSNLMITGNFINSNEEIYPREIRKLGEDILLVFFENSENEPIEQIQLFLEPMGFHFGIDIIVNNKFEKTFTSTKKTVTIPFIENDTYLGMINIPALVELMPDSNTIDSTSFAYYMINTTPKIILKSMDQNK